MPAARASCRLPIRVRCACVLACALSRWCRSDEERELAEQELVLASVGERASA